MNERQLHGLHRTSSQDMLRPLVPRSFSGLLWRTVSTGIGQARWRTQDQERSAGRDRQHAPPDRHRHVLLPFPYGDLETQIGIMSERLRDGARR